LQECKQQSLMVLLGVAGKGLGWEGLHLEELDLLCRSSVAVNGTDHQSSPLPRSSSRRTSSNHCPFQPSGRV